MSVLLSMLAVAEGVLVHLLDVLSYDADVLVHTCYYLLLPQTVW